MGLKVYKAPVTIGRENGRPSTWFHGYDEKFFYDRGVLYHFLYGRLALPMAVRFLVKHRDTMFAAAGEAAGQENRNGEAAGASCRIGMAEAFALMRKGIRMRE